MALTLRQQCFVEQFLIDLCQTKAAIRAGFSAKSAKEQAHQLMQKPAIKAAIAEAMAERSKRTGINQDRVLRELARIGLANMAAFVTWDASGIKMKPSEELSEDDTACIAEITETETEVGPLTTKTTIKIKLHDKRAALVDLGKHLGMFNEKLELSGNVDHRHSGTVIHEHQDLENLDEAALREEAAKLAIAAEAIANQGSSQGD